MNLKKTIILLAAALVFVNIDAARVNKFGKDTEVCDPVLIYTGGMAKRASWTRDNLMPYVVHTYADGTQKWLYDAFIFNETSWWGSMLINNLGSKPATKAEWTAYIDHIFADSHDLGALDKIITDMIPVLGEPLLKHKVIISMCVPCMYYSYRSPDGGDAGFQWTKYNWGTIDGVDIDFSNSDHRLAAVKWYVDEVISRFNAKGYKNIELAGFYSMEEDMNPRVSNGDMQKYYNDYVHECGLRAYWIPYWGANVNVNPTAVNWKEAYHFDMAYRQPNYFFYNSDGTLPPFERLQESISNSKTYGLGLELEFETTEKSNGLNEVSPKMHQRLIDYIDEFERLGVWENSGVAHYGGSVGYINMAKSTDAVNHATMDRLAQIVDSRQKAFAEELGVNVPTSDDLEAFAFGGSDGIFISEKCTNACVFSLSGIELYRGTGLFTCQKGVYIVTDGLGRSAKIIVK